MLSEIEYFPIFKVSSNCRWLIWQDEAKMIKLQQSRTEQRLKTRDKVLASL
jgi:hypothetical protein